MVFIVQTNEVSWRRASHKAQGRRAAGPWDTLVTRLVGPSSLRTLLGESESEHTVSLSSLQGQSQMTPIDEWVLPLLSGCSKESTLKALWDLRRVELFYCDGGRQDFMEKAVFGTGVEGFLKAKLRDVGVLGESYNILSQGGGKAGRPCRKHSAIQFSCYLGMFGRAVGRRRGNRLALCYRLNACVHPPAPPRPKFLC